jgi:hypothetical protein
LVTLRILRSEAAKVLTRTVDSHDDDDDDDDEPVILQNLQVQARQVISAIAEQLETF